MHQLLDAKSKSGALLRAALGPAGVPSVTQLFAPGQFVRAVVTAVHGGEDEEEEEGGGKAGKKRARRGVELSLLLKALASGLAADGLQEGMALPACVKTVEDHGYTLVFGIKGAQGFLKKAEHEAALGEGATLLPGQLVETVVRSAKDPRQVTVTTRPSEVAAAATREWEGLAQGSLLPGALVTARVRKVLADGLLVSFLTYFHGTVDKFHLTTALPRGRLLPPRLRAAAGRDLRQRGRAARRPRAGPAAGAADPRRRAARRRLRPPLQPERRQGAEAREGL